MKNMVRTKGGPRKCGRMSVEEKKRREKGREGEGERGRAKEWWENKWRERGGVQSNKGRGETEQA